MRQVDLVAQTDSTALILGETGSGKEIIARHIHVNSARANNNFIRVNCGAIPSDLIDSELFGHEKGSFTGATALKKGWFERAHGGTLFLDEVGELSLAAQVRLLRVLQEGTLCRVGGEKEIEVNVRIVAATHKNLEESCKNGSFREDLWFRINVFPITLPSLRHRPEDFRDLTEYFAQNASVKLGLPLALPSQTQINYLMQYHWPGNIRELQVIVERAAILGQGTHLAIEESLIINPELLTSHVRHQLTDSANFEASPISLDDVIRQHITKTLIYCHGRIEGPFGAAKRLAVNPNTLRSKIQKLGISKLNNG